MSNTINTIRAAYCLIQNGVLTSTTKCLNLLTMSGKHDRWSLIAQFAAANGVTKAALDKWRLRGVPHWARYDLARLAPFVFADSGAFEKQRRGEGLKTEATSAKVAVPRKASAKRVAA